LTSGMRLLRLEGNHEAKRFAASLRPGFLSPRRLISSPWVNAALYFERSRP
jgi:hypothetical protein